MTRYGLVFVLLSTLPFANFAHASSSDLKELQAVEKDVWSLVRDDRRHNIKTYTKWEEGKKYRTFKYSIIYKENLDQVVRIALDYAAMPKWYFRCKEAKIIKQYSPYEADYFQRFAGPIGQPDREIHGRIKITPASKSNKSVVLLLKSRSDAKPIYAGSIMAEFSQEVSYTPIENNQVLSISEGYFDPGEDPPAWMANYIQRNAAYESLLSMQRYVRSQAKNTEPIPFTYKE